MMSVNQIISKIETAAGIFMLQMSCSGIAGMNLEAVNFVQSNLLLNLTDTQATVQFTRMIEESLKSKFPR